MNGHSHNFATAVRIGGGCGYLAGQCCVEVSLGPVSSKVCINDINNLSVCIDNNVHDRSVFKL